MAEKKIDIGDGAAIPSKQDIGLFSAWWIALTGGHRQGPGHEPQDHAF